MGMEEAARRERYRLLFEAATEPGTRAVATGHHQGDQAETVLLHLLRGGGVHGAAGMAECAAAPFHDAALVNNISQEKQSVTIARSTAWLWRPLLTEPREVITAYVQGIGLEPIEDQSNVDSNFSC